MRLRLLIQISIVALGALAAVGCSSVEPRRELIAGRAVIVYAPDRRAVAAAAAARLAELGFDVATTEEGPPVRLRSSVAVYRVAREEDVVEPVQAALDVLGDVEWLPFVHSGPPNTDVVVWLVSRERDAAAKAAAAAEESDEAPRRE